MHEKTLLKKNIVNTLILKVGTNKSSESAAFLFYKKLILNISYRIEYLCKYGETDLIFGMRVSMWI